MIAVAAAAAAPLLHERYLFTIEANGRPQSGANNLSMMVDMVEMPNLAGGHAVAAWEFVFHDVFMTPAGDGGRSAVRLPEESQQQFSRRFFALSKEDGALAKVR